MMKEYLNRNFAIVWFILTVFAVFFWLIIGRRFNLSDLITYSTYSCLLYLIYNSRSLRSKNEIIYISGNLILIIGIFFKIMHWPFANVLIVFNSAGLTAWLFTDFYFLKGKNIIVNILSIVSILWILIIIWGMFFNDGYPYNFEGFMFFLIIFIVYSLVYFLIKSYKVRRILRENK